MPDYCCLAAPGDDDGDDGRVIEHAWFGPGGTVSPCHHDPYHNLLAQVVGAKRVTLFDAAQAPRLYPHDGDGLRRNTARVDVEAHARSADAARRAGFERFARARGYACTLRAGEMLYIPPGMWHHIRSLETSFSVSFWWGSRREFAHRADDDSPDDGSGDEDAAE